MKLTQLPLAARTVIPKAKMYFTPLNTFTLTTWETVAKVCGVKQSTEQFVGSVKVSGVVTSGALAEV